MPLQFPVLEKVIENSALIERLDEQTTRVVLKRLLELTRMVMDHFIENAWAREIDDSRRSGDHLLTLKEVSERLKRSPKSISQGWRKGRYPFLMKDGAHLVGSQDGLDRWIKARTSKSA